MDISIPYFIIFALMIIQRTEMESLLRDKLTRYPCVILLGPRQVGKTTLAKQIHKGERPNRYFDLESFNDLSLVQEDPETLFQNYEDDLVVLDEVQVLPSLFTVLRSIIDRKRSPGRFLLLGSANPALVKGVSESLAGRISYVELSTFTLDEVGAKNLEKLWLRGGFPNAFLAKDDDVAFEWILDYVRSYAERDLSLMYGVSLDVLLLKKLWRMIASLHGAMLNANNLSRSLGVSNHTVNRYINFLEGAYLLVKLQPWFVNVGKRLVKSPKIYLNDTGILHGLNGIGAFDDLLHHPIVGASWEGFVIQQIKYALKGRFEIYFYRTHNGTEADLVITDGIVPIGCVEIKNSNNPSISKGFYIAIDDLKTTNNYLITRSRSRIIFKDIIITSLTSFLRDEIPKLQLKK